MRCAVIFSIIYEGSKSPSIGMSSRCWELRNANKKLRHKPLMGMGGFAHHKQTPSDSTKLVRAKLGGYTKKRAEIY